MSSGRGTFQCADFRPAAAARTRHPHPSGGRRPRGPGLRLRTVAGNEHAPLFAFLDNRARCAAVGEQFRFLPRGILVGENTGLDGVPRFRRERDFPRDDCLVIGGGNRRGGRLRNRLRRQVRRGVARESQRTRRKNQQHQHNHTPQPPARHLPPIKPLFHASHVLRLHFLGSGRRYARAEAKMTCAFRQNVLP